MWADIIGTFGVGLIVIFYWLLQIGKVEVHSLKFSLFNSIGSVMILYSLFQTWNLASFIIEIFWLVISLYGVYKYFRKKG